MATFSYQGTQAAPQLAATQYNVQPNLSAARAIQGVQQSILGAMKVAGQLKAEVNQTNYEKEALAQQQRQAEFAIATAEMGYEEKAKAFDDYAKVNATLYDQKNPYGRKLFATEQSFILGAQQRITTQGIEERNLDNQADLNNSFQVLKEKWVSAAPEDKPALLAEAEATLVKPLEGFTDPKSKALYNTATKLLGDFKTTLASEQTLARDQTYASEALGFVVSHINVNGTIDKGTYEQVIADKLSKISTYGEKGNALRAKLDENILNSIVATATERMGKNPTAAQAQQLMAEVQNFAKISPQIKGSDSYKEALKSATAVGTAVDRQDVADLNAMLNDDTVTTAQFKAQANMLRGRNLLSDAEVSNALFQKGVRTENKNVKGDAALAYARNDNASLTDLVNRGHGAAVGTIVTANLSTELSTLAGDENIGPLKAITQVLEKAATFTAQGIPVGKIEVIDNILEYPKNNGIQSRQDAEVFVKTMEAAIEHGYSPAVRKQIGVDYAVLQAWLKTGVTDIADKFKVYKNNTQPVKKADVEKAFDEAVDNEAWARDITPATRDKYFSALAPGIKGLLQAGLTVDEATDVFERMIESDYVEVQPTGFFNNRVLMPRVDGLDSVAAYNNVFKTLGKKNTIFPMDIYKPNGNWAVIDAKTNEVREYPFEAIKYVAKYGSLPDNTK